MMHTNRRVLAVVTLASLAGSIEGRTLPQVVKVGLETVQIDQVVTFRCSPEPISVRFVGQRTFSATYHHDPEGALETARQHNVAKFDHYDPDTGEKLSHDNWTVSLTADHAENAATVTGAYWKLTDNVHDAFGGESHLDSVMAAG